MKAVIDSVVCGGVAVEWFVAEWAGLLLLYGLGGAALVSHEKTGECRLELRVVRVCDETGYSPFANPGVDVVGIRGGVKVVGGTEGVCFSCLA